MNKPVSPAAVVRGEEHWTNKGSDVRLFLWNKHAGDPSGPAGRILFVHGSSMASQPTFDLQVPGRADSSVMDYFAARGYDTWCVDMEGYGRSDQDSRQQRAHRLRRRRLLRRRELYREAARQAAAPGLRHFVGRAARGLVCAAPPGDGRAARARRHGLDRRRIAHACRAQQAAAEFRAKNRRPIDRKFVRSIFERDHPGTADDAVIEAFADAILALDNSVPTGTYVDMCSNLPVCDPEKITVPTLIMRGEYDGIASFSDLVKFFEKLPNPDKQFAVMPGIAHASFHQKNYAICYHILASFFSQPAPIYKSGH